MTMGYCPHCGAEISEGFAFCPKCGRKISDVTEGKREENAGELSQGALTEALVCPTCGFANQTGAKSCESCGSFLGGVEVGRVEKSRPAPIPPAADERRETPKKQPSRKQKKQKEVGQSSARGANAAKKFRLEPYQVAIIAAALLIGVILVYGLLSSKHTASPQGNSNATAQQQAATGQPSANVLHDIDRLRQIVDKNPADLGSTLKLSNMLQDNGFYDQAAVYYKRYLDKEPKNVDARIDYGVTLFEGGHAQQGIDQLNEALRIDPKHQIGYFNLGVIYLNSGDFEKANAAFKKCVEIDPNTDIGKKSEQILKQHANIGNQEVK